MQRVAVFSVIAGGIAIYGIALGGHLRLIMFVFGILLYEIQNIGLVKAPSDSLAFLALTGGLTIVVIPNHGPAMGMLQLVTLAAGSCSMSRVLQSLLLVGADIFLAVDAWARKHEAIHIILRMF